MTGKVKKKYEKWGISMNICLCEGNSVDELKISDNDNAINVYT